MKQIKGTKYQAQKMPSTKQRCNFQDRYAVVGMQSHQNVGIKVEICIKKVCRQNNYKMLEVIFAILQIMRLLCSYEQPVMMLEECLYC